jgi:putative SOS response-associated peptidase YedK
MCNDYRNRKSAAEVASHFRIPAGHRTLFNVPEEVFPKYPGMVVRVDEGARSLQSMVWGFPRENISKVTGKPLKPTAVNNARDDRLLDPFWPWKESFEQRRCLIPLTEWAEAEGPKGQMTKTWYSLHGADLFAVGGIWRPTDEWGDAYSMVMVDGCKQMADVHDRMPVILRPEQYEQWTEGSVEDALALVQTCNDMLAVDRSVVRWGKISPAEQQGTIM